MCGFELVDALVRRSRISAHFFAAGSGARPYLVGGSFGARTMLEHLTVMLGVRVVVAARFELLDIDESKKKVATLFAAAFIDQLEDEALAATSTMNEHIFEGDELMEMRAHLELAPTRQLAHATIREAIV